MSISKTTGARSNRRSSPELRRRAKLEKARRLQRERWRLHPRLWLKERLGEDLDGIIWDNHPEYKDHDWDGTPNPMMTAWEQLARSYSLVKDGGLPDFKNIAVESGTGTGKTYVLARIVVWYLDVFEDSLVITSAPSDNQLKMGLWSEISALYPKIKRLRPTAKKWQLRLAMNWQINDNMTEEEKIQLESNAWHAKGFVTGTNSTKESEDKARGFHRKYMLIILEECTGIPIPIINAFKNTCTGNTNFIMAVGNPNDEHDPLHIFAMQKGTRHVRASALDHPNIVLGKEIYAGAVTQSSINDRTHDFGKGTPFWNAMVRGISPPQATDALIKIDWINQCINLKVNKVGHNAVGIDVANSVMGDKAAVAFGTANILEEVQEFQCPNATHLAYNLIYDTPELADYGYHDYGTSTIHDYEISSSYIGIDAVGVGVATVNAFTDEGIEVISIQGGQWEEAIPIVSATGKPMYQFNNLRSQMMWQLREDLRKKNISIQVNDPKMLEQIKFELRIPRLKMHEGKIVGESKEDIKKRMAGKSPNVFDCIMYWNWVRHGYRLPTLFNMMPAMGSGA